MRSSSLLFSILALTSLQLQAEESEENCGNAPATRRGSLRHIESKGIGYRQGYTSVDLFVASNQPMRSLVPFVDARFHIFNNGLPALNAGMGLRYLTNSWVYGINTYYDYRKTHRFHYNQVAVGLEALGKRFDVRLNGYLPVGSKKSPFFQTKFSHFQEHSAFLSSKQEFAMKGLNLEAGCHLKKMKYASFYAAAGPYYFENEGKNAIGGEARVSVTIYDYLKLTVNGSFDPVFHGIGQGELSVVLPFGPKSPVKKRANTKCSNQLILRERALQPVDRSEIIVLDRKRTITKAINPATNTPYIFYFVNNTSHSDGTFESPFTTMGQAQTASNPGDILYVYEGIGSYDVGSAGFTLKNNQKLWGSGTIQNLDTTLGTVGIANQTGGLPLVTSTGTANFGIINLANNNEVSGFHVQGTNGTTLGYGILGGDANALLSVSNALIQNNLLDGTYGRSAIRVVGKGAAILTQNRVNATVGNGFSGIDVIALGSDTLNASIYSNTVAVTGAAGGTAYGIKATSYNTSTLAASIYSNTVAVTGAAGGTAYGIRAVSYNTSTLAASIYSNTVATGAAGGNAYGILATSYNTSTLAASIYSNTVAVTGAAGRFAYGIRALSTNTSTLAASIYSNTVAVTGAAGGFAYGIAAISFDTSTLAASIYSNTVAVTGAAGGFAYGIRAESQNTSTLAASIYSNTVAVTVAAGSTAYGILAVSYNTSTLAASIYSNTVAVTGAAGRFAYGIRALSTNTSTLAASIYSNTVAVTGAAGGFAYGIRADSYDTSTSAASIYSNTVAVTGAAGSTAVGIKATSYSTSTLAASIYSNTVAVTGAAGGTAYGIWANLVGGGLAATIQDNTGTVSGSATDKQGVKVDAGVTGIFAPNTIVVE